MLLASAQQAIPWFHCSIRQHHSLSSPCFDMCTREHSVILFVNAKDRFIGVVELGRKMQTTFSLWCRGRTRRPIASFNDSVTLHGIQQPDPMSRRSELLETLNDCL